MGRCNPVTKSCTRADFWRDSLGVNWFGSAGGGTPETVEAPYFLNIYVPTSGVGISGRIINQGADSYDYKLTSDIEGNTIVDSDLANVSNDFSFTGLTNNQVLYIHARARVGSNVSAWTTKQCRTIFSGIQGWYEFTRFYNFSNLTDEYGTINTSRQISSIKSIVNTSGPLLSKAGANFALLEPKNKFTVYQNLTPATSNNFYDLASPIVLSGSFTIMIKAAPGAAGTRIFCTETANADFSWIRLAAGTTIATKINNIQYTPTFPDGLSTQQGLIYDFVIQRELITGTPDTARIRISADGGLTWSTWVSCVTDNFNVNRFFSNATGGNNYNEISLRVAFSSGLLDSDQMKLFFNFNGRYDSFTAETNTESPVGGLSEVDLTDGRWDDNIAAGQNSFARKQMWTVGDKTILWKVGEHADFSPGSIRYLNHANGKGSALLDTGFYDANADTHNFGSWYPFDNRFVSLQPNTHYSVAPQSTTGWTNHVRSSKKGFDFSTGLTEIVVGNGAKSFIAQTNYHQITSIGNTLYAVCQDYQSWPRRLLLISSIDGGINWTLKEQICDVNTTNADWFYPHLVYNGTHNELFLIAMWGKNIDAAPDPYHGAYFLRSTGNGVWGNLDNSFTRNVRTVGLLTKAELDANGFTIFNASALVGSAAIGNFFITSTGIIYGTISNGEETAWRLALAQLGTNSWTFKTIGWDGKTVVTDTLDEAGSSGINSFNRSAPIVWRRGANSYSVAGLEANSGNWRLIEVRTSDNGDTWTYEQDLTPTADARQYILPNISANYEFANYSAISAYRSNSVTTDGNNCWIKEVKNNGVVL